MRDTYSLEFTEEQIQIIVTALHDCPVKYALPIIYSIQKQITVQIEARAKIQELINKSKQ